MQAPPLVKKILERKCVKIMAKLCSFWESLAIFPVYAVFAHEDFDCAVLDERIVKERLDIHRSPRKELFGIVTKLDL